MPDLMYSVTLHMLSQWVRVSLGIMKNSLEYSIHYPNKVSDDKI